MATTRLGATAGRSPWWAWVLGGIILIVLLIIIIAKVAKLIRGESDDTEKTSIATTYTPPVVFPVELVPRGPIKTNFAYYYRGVAFLLKKGDFARIFIPKGDTVEIFPVKNQKVGVGTNNGLPVEIIGGGNTFRMFSTPSYLDISYVEGQEDTVVCYFKNKEHQPWAQKK